MRVVAVAIALLLSLMPNRTSTEPDPQPQKPLPPSWSFVSPGVVELHADGNCLSWVLLFRQVSDGTWIYRVVPVPRAKCQPHPGEYPDNFFIPYT